MTGSRNVAGKQGERMKTICLCLAAFVLAAFAAAGEAAPDANLPEVGVVTIKSGTVALTTQLNGRAVARLVAEVRPQVNGIIQQRLFDEGTDVKADSQLYQIDPRMYEAQLMSAKADLEKAKANAEVARAKKIRYDELLSEGAVSKQDYDEVTANHLQAQAEIGIAEAQVTIAQINVDYTKVFAPISGRIGKSGVTEGALVTANQTSPLATIQQIDPIYVDISQSTAGLLQLKRALDSGTLRSPGKDGPVVNLVLEDGEAYPHEGKVLFSEITVDQDTGSISMRTEFPNPEWDLLPGMYVKAMVRSAEKDAAITIPQAGLLRSSDGSAYVYVVGADGTVEKRPVTIMTALKNTWLIGDGLKEGEKVVVEGTQRIRFIPDTPAPRVRFVEVAGEEE